MTEVSTDDMPDVPAPSRARVRAGGRPRGSTGAVVLAVAAAGAVAAAVVLGQRPARFNGTLEALAAGDPSAEAAAREALTGMADYATARIPPLLADPSPLQRLRGVRAAETLDLKETAAAMAGLASDPDPSVRAAAAHALGHFASGGDASALKSLLDLADKPGSGPAVTEAVGRLSLAAEGARLLLAERAAKALGASSLHPDAAVRTAYLQALTAMLIDRLSASDGAAPLPLLQAIVASAADPSPAVRSEADAALRQVPAARRATLAADCLDHADPWIRVWAEGTLRTASGACQGHDPFAPEADRRAGAEAWKAWTKSRP